MDVSLLFIDWHLSSMQRWGMPLTLEDNADVSFKMYQENGLKNTIFKNHFKKCFKGPFPSQSQLMWLLGSSPSSGCQGAQKSRPQIQPDYSLLCTRTPGDSNRIQEAKMSSLSSPTQQSWSIPSPAAHSSSLDMDPHLSYPRPELTLVLGTYMKWPHRSSVLQINWVGKETNPLKHVR